MSVSTLRELAESLGVSVDDADLARFVEVFTAQLRANGRAHHRALLAAMRKHLDLPATATAQEVALTLAGRLRFTPPGVNDLPAVRQALKSETSS
ncbi:MAG TPA: hypothetical protein VMY39_01855 [Planctomycetota bacterium]|nr:hypothetical protein [Planctomycetota bacterium]